MPNVKAAVTAAVRMGRDNLEWSPPVMDPFYSHDARDASMCWLITKQLPGSRPSRCPAGRLWTSSRLSVDSSVPVCWEATLTTIRRSGHRSLGPFAAGRLSSIPQRRVPLPQRGADVPPSTPAEHPATHESLLHATSPRERRTPVLSTGQPPTGVCAAAAAQKSSHMAKPAPHADRTTRLGSGAVTQDHRGEPSRLPGVTA